MPSILQSALAYAARGWHVLILHGMRNGACTCGDAACENPGKHPLTASGLKDATRDPDVIASWFEHRPWANLGIAAGASGLAVLDIDLRKGGMASLEQLLKRLRISILGAGKVRTGNGWHLYFIGPAATSVQRLGPGLDVRGIGGYVVAPPSRHFSGVQYEWVREVAVLPDWPFPEPEAVKVEVGEAIPEGARNATLFSVAGSLHGKRIPSDVLRATLHFLNERLCRPPLSSREVDRIANNILQRPHRGPGLIDPAQRQAPAAHPGPVHRGRPWRNRPRRGPT